MSVTSHRIYEFDPPGPPTAEGQRLLADPDVQRCLNRQTLDDILCCYGECPPPREAGDAKRGT